MAKKRNIIVGQSGGPTSVINSSLAGVYKNAIERGFDKVYGMLHGIQGLLDEQYVDLSTQIHTELDIELLKRTPSAFLGSCRFKLPEIHEDKAIYEKIFSILNKLDIHAFIYIGGNDSMDTIKKLSDYAILTGQSQKFLGVPKTIDNDLALTDHTPGFGSAAKYTGPSTKEVIQANKFDNSDKELLEAKIKETGWSYLKSPAGIFTEATLPYKDISEKLATDTLNSVKLTFTNYAQENNNKYEFSMSTPETVLLLRKKDMDTFFVNNELANNVTSFVATHNSVETNQYTFKNIARLVSTCINEKKAAKQKAKEAAGVSWDEAAWEAEWSREGGEGADWDKVVLIPVVVTYDTNSTNPSIISIQHDLKPTYAKLKGGDPAYGGNNLQIEVTYTSFNK